MGEALAAGCEAGTCCLCGSEAGSPHAERPPLAHRLRLSVSEWLVLVAAHKERQHVPHKGNVRTLDSGRGDSSFFLNPIRRVQGTRGRPTLGHGSSAAGVGRPRALRSGSHADREDGDSDVLGTMWEHSVPTVTAAGTPRRRSAHRHCRGRRCEVVRTPRLFQAPCLEAVPWGCTCGYKNGIAVR